MDNIVDVTVKTYEFANKPIQLAYLIVTDFKECYLAYKCDCTSGFLIKINAIKISNESQADQFQSIMSSSDDSLYEELIIPSCRIKKIKNMIFRKNKNGK